MLKRLLLMLMILLLWAGTSLASQFTILNVSPGVGLVGQINFKVDDFYTWGYCIEKEVDSYIGTPYTGTLEELTGDKLWQAYFIYMAYKDGSVSNDEAKQLQESIWGTEPSSFNLDVGLESMLKQMFLWAKIPNVGNYGQDFIVAAPVPEPASMILFGTGLFVFGYVGRKYKKI